MAAQPLIINNWEQGIADSPHKGFGLFRNVDIESFPGAVKTAKKPGTYFHDINTVTFTADAGTDVCTASGTIEANGENFAGGAVYFTTTGTLPTGLSTNTAYFLIKTGTTTFQVATSYQNSVGSAAGTQINITNAGSGTHTMTQIAIGTINWILKDPRNSYLWFLSSNGRVWFTPNSQRAYLLHNSAIEDVDGSLTHASGNGMTLHSFSSTIKKWLFVYRNNAIDVIDVYDTTAIEALGWSNGWQTMNTGSGTNNQHQALVGQDDIIYYTDDRYVGSIKEVSGQTFAPATGGTYTFTSQALDTPSGEVTQCIEELGTNLLIGGNNSNQIYPWDRLSDSFNLPMSVPEYSIKRMKNVGGAVYILAGTWGNVYSAQGNYVSHVLKLPTYLTNNTGTILSNPITWGGISESHGSLLFGVATTLAGNSGVWRLYPDGTLIIDNIPSSGPANVIGLWAEDDFYVMGYSGGADTFNSLVTGTALYDSFEGVIHSPLFKVSTKIQKGMFSRLEVVLAKPASGGSVRVSYREDLSSAFTTIDTFTADSSTQIFSSEGIGLIDIENIQIQIEMNDSAVGSIDTELLEVRLLP